MSTIAAARLPDADNDRLVELARRKGLRRPEMIRELMHWALDKWAEAELEDTEPPDGG
jgi:hypothetical protein